MAVKWLLAGVCFFMSAPSPATDLQSQVSHRVSAYCRDEGPRHALSRHYRGELRRELSALQQNRAWNSLSAPLKEQAERIVSMESCS